MAAESTIEAVQDVLNAQQEESGLLEELSDIIEEMKKLNCDRTETFERLAEAHTMELDTLKRQHANAVAKLQKDYETKIQALKFDHRKALDPKEENIADLRGGITNLVAYAKSVLHIGSDPCTFSPISLVTEIEKKEEIQEPDQKKPSSLSLVSDVTGLLQHDIPMHTEMSIDRTEFCETVEANVDAAFLERIPSSLTETVPKTSSPPHNDVNGQQLDAENPDEVGWTRVRRRTRPPPV